MLVYCNGTTTCGASENAGATRGCTHFSTLTFLAKKRCYKTRNYWAAAYWYCSHYGDVGLKVSFHSIPRKRSEKAEDSPRAVIAFKLAQVNKLGFNCSLAKYGKPLVFCCV